MLKETNENPSSLALKAGLARGHLHHIISGKAKSINNETAAKLAAITSFDPHWIATGNGQPYRLGALVSNIPELVIAQAPAEPPKRQKIERPDVVRDDDYPSRGTVIALIRGKVDANVVAALASIRLESDRDPGEAFWMKEVKRLKRALQELESDAVEAEPMPGDRMPPS